MQAEHPPVFESLLRASQHTALSMMAGLVLAIHAILQLHANRRRSPMRLPIPRKDRLKAIPLARISERTAAQVDSSQRQLIKANENKRKQNSFLLLTFIFYLRLFFRIEIFQWVTSVSNKKPPSGA
jgi:hypothetical protein